MFRLFKRVKNISLKELQEQMNQSYLLLDVRTPEEYRSGHLANAINVPLQRVTSYKPTKEQEIYVICQSGMRSKQAARLLEKRGYAVTNVKEGMNAWHGPVRREK